MHVNNQVRQAIKKRMTQRGLSQAALGEMIAMSQPNIARILSGRSGKVPHNVQQILDALGLELIAVPKGTDVSECIEKGE